MIKGYRRINLFAGSGAGKSTTAAYIFAKLKEEQFTIELINEYVKAWAHQGRKPTSFDQIYLFGKQVHMEDRVLRNGVDFIVTDSPIALSPMYAAKYCSPAMSDHLWSLSHLIDMKYPPINIFLRRKDRFFKQQGRFENLEQAKEMDTFIYDQLCSRGMDFIEWDSQDRDNLFHYIKGQLHATV